MKFAIEAAITILQIGDFIKLHRESKYDKHGSCEDAIHSGSLDDWSLFYNAIKYSCLIPVCYTLKYNKLSKKRETFYMDCEAQCQVSLTIFCFAESLYLI